MLRGMTVEAIAGVVLVTTSCGARTEASLGAPSSAEGGERCLAVGTPSEVLDPRCPRQVPEIGEPCSQGDLVCAYERCVETGQEDVAFTCPHGSFFFEDRWPCEPNPEHCPPCLPEEGARCDPVGSVCRYAPGAKAMCRPDGWLVWSGARYSLP